MKKYLVFLMIVCLLFSSCQAAAPQEGSAGSSQIETENSKAEMATDSKADDSIYHNDDVKPVSVKEAEGYGPWNWKEFFYQDSFHGEDGKALINVDISGRYLDEPVPVLRISHHVRTAEDLKEFAEKLMPADVWYDPTKLIEPEILQSWTDDAEHRILKAKYDTKLTADQKEKAIRQAEEDLVFCSSLTESRESDPDKAMTDWQTHSTAENYYDLKLRTVRSQEGNVPMELSIRTACDENGDFHFLQIRELPGNSNYDTNLLEYCKANAYESIGYCHGIRDTSNDPSNTMTRSEVMEMVQKQLNELGLDMHITAASGSGFGMTFWYYPTYFGIDYLGIQNVYENGMDECPPERLRVKVFGDEIWQFQWRNAANAVIENDSLPLLSKEEVLDAFKKHMQTAYSGENAANAGEPVYPKEILDEAKNVRIDVSRMNFGYVRIPIEGEPDESRLVPAWMFYGRTYLEYEEGVDRPVPMEDANPGIADGSVLMIVNAVDGSYIPAEQEDYPYPN